MMTMLPRAQEYLQALVNQPVLRLGLQLQCPLCSQPNWYDLARLADTLICERCLQSFPFPAASPPQDAWHYRAIGPFAMENYAKGSYSVALSLAFFDRFTGSEMTWIPFFLLTGKDGTELEADFALLWRQSRFDGPDPILIFGACKTYDKFNYRDVKRLKALGEVFSGSVLAFSTFRKELKAQERKWLVALTQKGRRRLKADQWQNPVLILTGLELFAQEPPPDCWKAAGGRFAPFAATYPGAGAIQELCDFTQQIHLGLESYAAWQEKESQKRRTQRAQRKKPERKMKYVIVVGDGMGDYPIPMLGGQTPLEAAATPNLDGLARRGELGLARTIPEDMEPGSDIANLAIMGYDPARYHTGRAPLEAAALGVPLGPEEVAFRCNLVTLRREDSGLFMEDYSAGHIGSDEARELIAALESALARDGRHFYPGVSYRHLLVWAQGEVDWRTYPPHDFIEQEVGHFMTSEGPEHPLWELIQASWPILKDHEVNRRRASQGQKPATSIWLWGQGRPPKLPTLEERFGLTGAVISAVDLIRGMGIYAGLKPIRVPGATGFLDTNYAGKVQAALEALKEVDLVFLHVEAPDEAGHSGDVRLKLRALRDFDSQVVGPLLQGLKNLAPHRLLVLCDHFTPLAVRTHTREPVPFALYDSRTAGDQPRPFTEAAAKNSGLLLEQGADLLPRLLGKG